MYTFFHHCCLVKSKKLASKNHDGVSLQSPLDTFKIVKLAMSYELGISSLLFQYM